LLDTLGLFIAAALTLMVFSYIFGDNFLFELASHIFVGVAVGYATLVVIYEVFIPLVTSGQHIVTILPALFLCFLLIFRIFPARSETSNALAGIALAFVLGVGVALAIGGGLFGTLIPQVSATAGISWNPNHYPDTENEVGLVNWLNNIIIVLGTLGTLFYFTFAVRARGFMGGVREAWVRFWAGMGRLMIIFTLGALFANTVSARVALLISRIQFLMSFFGG
jgi:hypothetical protein